MKKGKKPSNPPSGGPQDVPPPPAAGKEPKKPRKIRPLSKNNDGDDDDDNKGEIASSRDHRMRYVDRSEVINALRLSREADWYNFMLKEKFDNAIDFLWKYYPDAPPEEKIVVAKIRLDYDKKLFRCTVTNTNAKNKPVFQNLDRILNFDMTWGTKQNDYVISRGTLGDALKRLAAIPYTLMKEDLGVSDSVTGSEQWTHPTTFRFNHQEYKSVLNVDDVDKIIEAPPLLTGRGYIPDTKTTIEHIWHIPDKVRHPDNSLNYLTSSRIQQFCRKYLIFTTDIYFVVHIDDEYDRIVIDLPATQSLKQTASLKNWINISSIFYYSLERFRNLLVSIDDKEKITVYQLIKTRFREWTQKPKKDVPDLDISISEFLGKDESIRAKKILSLYLRLRTEGTITTPPDKLSLPYTHKQERKAALAARIEDIVFSGDLDTSKAVYEIMPGVASYTDNASGGLTVQYPYAVEIIAIPFYKDAVEKAPDAYKSNYLAGAINYSVSPGGEDNTFTGYYTALDKKTGRTSSHSNIVELFKAYGFNFDPIANNTQDTKVPCVVAVNLISPVLSYTSEGKSNIDTDPFDNTLEDIVEKIVNRILTFKRAGIITQDVIAANRQARERQELRQLRRQIEEDEKLRRQAERQQRREEREQEEEQKQKEREQEEET